MSVFDLFRGFFGVPGGHHYGRRDPFFDTMTHDDDDEDDEDGFRGDQQDPFDSTWRFGISLGPDGMRIQEPPMFGHIFREMEDIFSQLGRWEGPGESGRFGIPSIMPPPPSQDRAEKGSSSSSGNPLRDYMLKSPNSDTRGPIREPQGPPLYDSPEFHGWTPFSKFNDVWRRGPQRTPEEEQKGDRDLDSMVSSGGLDQILSPPAGQVPSQPRIHSFFQSVTVTKVVKPDGTVEERRTVRDSKGNEETTVTHSSGPGILEGPNRHSGPVLPGGHQRSSDLRDDNSLLSKFFGGFK
ncbi:HCLS1-associated protein X-1 [Pholidichthys leucotaenia]